MGVGNGVGAQPIADGVEDFQVMYGVRQRAGSPYLQFTKPAKFQYYRADQVTNWEDVDSVMVCLRLVGELAGNPQTGSGVNGCRGTSAGDEVIAPDGKLRRVFSRTFGLRNALL